MTESVNAGNGDTRRLAVVNTGSSTLKLASFDASADGLRECSSETFEWESPEAMDDTVRRALEELETTPAILAHRVVHGGDRYPEPVRIDEKVEKTLEDLVPLAPLHNEPALKAIHVAREVFPDTPFVAAFDTSFHFRRPKASTHYALPRDWNEEYRFRRYGFHGIAHESLADSYAEAQSLPLDDVRAVTLQLGSGCSACAIRNGRSIETSMGYTPLEGLVMSTRSGNVDPALVLKLVRAGIEPDEIEERLNRDSGLKGLAGTGDMREILAADVRGDRRARLALKVFLHRLVLEVGGFLTLLEGDGAVVFGGGVGTNSPEVRAGVAAGLAAWDVALDPARNLNNQPGRISRDGTRDVFVFETREEYMIARYMHEHFAALSR